TLPVRRPPEHLPVFEPKTDHRVEEVRAPPGPCHLMDLRRVAPQTSFRSNPPYLTNGVGQKNTRSESFPLPPALTEASVDEPPGPPDRQRSRPVSFSGLGGGASVSVSCHFMAR